MFHFRLFLYSTVFSLCLFGSKKTFAEDTREPGKFYLDSESGNDSASGRSPEQAWKTINRLNLESLIGGDSVLFKRGGLWRESLHPKSGKPGKPTIYDAYGTGPKPILQTSTSRNNKLDWRSCGENLWETVPVEPIRGKQIPVDFKVTWHVHQEKPAEVRLTSKQNVQIRLEVVKKGESPSRIQVIGPVITEEGLKTAAILKIRARSSKPFTVPSIVVRHVGSPWNNYLHASNPVSITEQWQEFDIFLPFQASGEKGQIVFYLGGGVQDDSVFEFEPISFHSASFPENREPLSVDVGNIVFDHGKAVGFKRWSLDELKEDLDFWHDTERGRVVLCSKKHPTECYHEIELCLKRNVVSHANLSDCIIRNLALRYSAAHGVGGMGSHRVIIEDCDIYYIGGGHLYTRNNRPTRYGNGIEWWSEASDCIAQRCRFWEIYDVAFTQQGNIPNKTIRNITMRDNIIWNCEQSYEYWRTEEGNGEKGKTLTENVIFENNVCIDSGYGWSHRQRPDKRGTHFLSYNVTTKTDIIIRNNVFYRGKNDCISMFTDWRDGVRLYNNLWYQPKGETFLSFRGKEVFKTEEFENYQKKYNMEQNSMLAKPVFINPEKRDYRLAPGSPGLTSASDGKALGVRNWPKSE